MDAPSSPGSSIGFEPDWTGDAETSPPRPALTAMTSSPLSRAPTTAVGTTEPRTPRTSSALDATMTYADDEGGAGDAPARQVAASAPAFSYISNRRGSTAIDLHGDTEDASTIRVAHASYGTAESPQEWMVRQTDTAAPDDVEGTGAVSSQDERATGAKSSAPPTLSSPQPKRLTIDSQGRRR